MRVAIVHDWLYTLGGAEKVLAAIFRCFPKADLFCLFDFLSAADRKSVGYTKSQVSFLQRVPGVRDHHRLFLPVMPLAIEQLDLSSYDLVISSSYAVAKGVLTGPDQLHLAYVHSPMRYAWDLQHQYLRESGMGRGPRGLLTRLLLHRIRMWDVRTSSGPDAYMANSSFIARRIRKIYGREARVIHPPVKVAAGYAPVRKARHFMTASRLVAYKNLRCIVEAFRQLPAEQLIVAGDGPEAAHLRAIAGPNVRFTGFLPDGELRRTMASARAFIFAAEEDFGIVPVEAQSEGTPVLALGRGGARETVRTGGHAPTGLFFDRPEPGQVADAVRRFIESEASFEPRACHENALRFSEERFHDAFETFVMEHYEAFSERLAGVGTQPLTPPRPDRAWVPELVPELAPAMPPSKLVRRV